MSAAVSGRPNERVVAYLIGFAHGRSGDIELANAFARAASGDWQIFLDTTHSMDTDEAQSERLERLLCEFGLASLIGATDTDKVGQTTTH